jgi:DNA-binding XRE family transcriptional regulator
MRVKRSRANQALGSAIRSTREQRGYSQEAFAARAGLDRANYGAIERGEGQRHRRHRCQGRDRSWRERRRAVHARGALTLALATTIGRPSPMTW